MRYSPNSDADATAEPQPYRRSDQRPDGQPDHKPTAKTSLHRVFLKTGIWLALWLHASSSYELDPEPNSYDKGSGTAESRLLRLGWPAKERGTPERHGGVIQSGAPGLLAASGHTEGGIGEPTAVWVPRSSSCRAQQSSEAEAGVPCSDM